MVVDGWRGGVYEMMFLYYFGIDIGASTMSLAP
jgi:hypothetical protein